MKNIMSTNMFAGEHKKLYLAILSATAMSFSALGYAAEEEKAQEEEKEVQEQQKEDKSDIEELIVTGSMIPRSNATEMTPMTIIGEDEMREKGLVTISDVMDSMTENSGYSEGAISNVLSGFTLGGSGENMRGLGAGRTLVLLNGRRIADYPLPFGGEGNGVDVGGIPPTVFSRVEYLSGGASAIYGSDAMGGVINVITKRDVEQTALSASFGSYEGGNGTNGSLSFLTGAAFDRGAITFAVETSKSNALNVEDIDWISENHNPSGSRVGLFDRMGEVTPTSGDCESIGIGSNEDGDCVVDPSRNMTWTPETERTSIYTDGRYELTDTITAFGNFLYVDMGIESKSALLSWGGTFLDENDNILGGGGKFFSEEEGGTRTSSINQSWWSMTAGLEGELELSGKPWYWTAAFSQTQYDYEEAFSALKEDGAMNWILEGVDFERLDSGMYRIDSGSMQAIADNIWRSPTAEEASDLFGVQTTNATSSGSTFNFLASGELFKADWLYNPVDVAFMVEYASQSTDIKPDERSKNIDGTGWVGLGSFESKGDRTRSAMAMEMNVPVTENLELSLAGRYDRYSDDSDISGRSTLQTKFKWQATDWMFARGGWTQTFRAPDMYNIYGVTKGFTTVPDIAGADCESLDNCRVSYAQVLQMRASDNTLKEERGQDWSLGLVVSPTAEFQVSLDWYKVEIKDLVNTGSAYDLMVSEWQCEGNGRDADSAFCQDISSRVIRNEAGSIESIQVKPINQASVEMQGLDLRASVAIETDNWGRFGLGMSYSNTLEYTQQTFEGDEALDIREGQRGFSTPHDRLSANVGWNYAISGFKSVGAGLFVQRQGSVDNFAGTKRMDPYYSVNLSSYYRAGGRTSLSLSIQNLLGTEPQKDDSNPFYWGYWTHLQNPLGRSVNLSVNYMID